MTPNNPMGCPDPAIEPKRTLAVDQSALEIFLQVDVAADRQRQRHVR